MKNEGSIIQEISDSSNDESSSDSPIQLKQKKRTSFPRKGREFFGFSEVIITNNFSQQKQKNSNLFSLPQKKSRIHNVLEEFF